jgi:hypothetical protein
LVTPYAGIEYKRCQESGTGRCARQVSASGILTRHSGFEHCPPPQGGAVAQLGERLVRNEEVRGSIPLSSTIRLAVSLPWPAKYLCLYLSEASAAHGRRGGHVLSALASAGSWAGDCVIRHHLVFEPRCCAGIAPIPARPGAGVRGSQISAMIFVLMAFAASASDRPGSFHIRRSGPPFRSGRCRRHGQGRHPGRTIRSSNCHPAGPRRYRCCS